MRLRRHLFNLFKFLFLNVSSCLRNGKINICSEYTQNRAMERFTKATIVAWTVWWNVGCDNKIKLTFFSVQIRLLAEFVEVNFVLVCVVTISVMCCKSNDWLVLFSWTSVDSQKCCSTNCLRHHWCSLYISHYNLTGRVKCTFQKQSILLSNTTAGCFSIRNELYGQWTISVASKAHFRSDSHLHRIEYIDDNNILTSTVIAFLRWSSWTKFSHNFRENY